MDAIPMDPTTDRLAVARRLTLVSLGTNLFLAVLKIVGGLLGNSSVVVADGVDSMSDIFTTLLAYTGVRMAEKAPDEEHPYGHERFEAVLGKALAFFLFLVAGAIVYKAWEEIRAPYVPPPTALALAAAAISIAGKVFLSQYTIRTARRIRSSIYEADGRNYLNDVLSSVLSLSGAFLAQQGFQFFQPVFSVIIALFVFRVGFELYRDSITDLTDRAADRTLTGEMQRAILANPGVRRIDLFRSRMHGKRVYVDLEIAVARDLSLVDAHGIAEAVHDELEGKFPEIKHVMVHVNPSGQNPGDLPTPPPESPQSQAS